MIKCEKRNEWGSAERLPSVGTERPSAHSAGRVPPRYVRVPPGRLPRSNRGNGMMQPLGREPYSVGGERSNLSADRAFAQPRLVLSAKPRECHNATPREGSGLHASASPLGLAESVLKEKKRHVNVVTSQVQSYSVAAGGVQNHHELQCCRVNELAYPTRQGLNPGCSEIFGGR